MMTRIGKLSLVAAVALYHSLVVFNNLSDFETNFAFVRHVLLMDSTFPGSHAHWRVLSAPWMHIAFYVCIIVWEAAVAGLLWWGSLRLLRSLRAQGAAWARAARVAVAGLTLSLLLWLVAFLCVGGEWFLMWQSTSWNGQAPAFRMFALVALVLLILQQPEAQDQPGLH